MLTSTSFAAALRDAHFELKRLAAAVETDVKSIIGRETIGPVWHYGQENEPTTVRYGDAQRLTLADSRDIVLTLDLVLHPDRAMAFATITVSNLPDYSHPEDPRDVDPDIVAQLGPMEASTDSDTAAMVRDLVGELFTHRDEVAETCANPLRW